MADQNSPIPQLVPGGVDYFTRINEIFDAVSPAGPYGRDARTCAGLQWGYYGGRWGGYEIDNNYVTLSGSSTYYMTVQRSDGTVAISTSNTAWNDQANHARAYKITTGTSTVTDYEDHRAGPGGTVGASDSASTDVAAAIHGATGKTTPVDADELGLVDSAASNVLKKLTWANLKATLKTYFDGLYFALTNLDTDGTLAANSDSKVATQKATKTYVDAKLAGLSWKQAVRAATTTAGTLASSFENGDTIDGVTLATGDRILIKNQSSGSENGIYTVNASGAPTRATDADSGAELVNASVYVSEGTANADTQWTCTTNAPITVGSTSLAFAQLTSGGGAFTGGTLTSALNEAPTTTLASASTVNIGAAAANTINITGTTTITAFDSIADGALRRVVFGGALTLTHNGTSLILPTGANITTAAGDCALLLSLGSGNWRCVQYLRANGQALAGGGGSSTQGKQAIYIPAGAMYPSRSSGCASLFALQISSGQPDLLTLDFDASTEEYAQFSLVMPKKWNEGTITAKFHWSHASTATNFGVVWALQAVAVGDDDAIGTSFGTAQTVTDTGGTTNDLYTSSETSAITVAGSPAAEDMVFFRAYRVAANGSDTLAIDARLHGVTVYITTDADTDA